MKRRFAYNILTFGVALFIGQWFGRGLAPSENSSREPANFKERRATTSSKNGIQILPMNSRFPASELKASGYDVIDLRERLREDAKAEPEPRERDQLFQKAGAWTFASRLDQLDRSFLFLRAHDYSAQEFARKYPRLSAKVRDQLQSAAKAWGK